MTDLIEVKTADLVGHALDWAVAQAEGLEVFLVGPQYNVPWRVFWKKRGQALEWDVLYNPHEDWALGGPLIDKHRGSVTCSAYLAGSEFGYNAGPGGETPAVSYMWCTGPTALVAFCRSLVNAKLGNIVQVPKELLS